MGVSGHPRRRRRAKIVEYILIVYDAPLALGNATKHLTFLQVLRNTTMRTVIEFLAAQIAVPIPDH